ncbi:MAG TPA: VWA domain-containing protein [Chthoniobacteraceae bacterium]|nr:VWA domain-containing protein [Chthoniobacteraceae bacterium]
MAREDFLMRFAQPEWFVLLPLIVAALFVPKLRLRKPLRIICLLLTVVVLAQPQVRRLGRGLDLWVLEDHSASCADVLEARLPEWEKLLERSKSPYDHIFYVDYADETELRDELNAITFDGSREFTHTATAIRFALARMSNDRTNRVLAITDGYSTEPLTDIGELLVRQHVPMDFRLAPESGSHDFRVDKIDLPPKVQIGEPFLVELHVSGDADAAVPFEIARDGKVIVHDKVSVSAGTGYVRFTDRVVDPGSHKYTARIYPAEDAHPGNNAGENWIEVAGGPRVLVVSGYTDDPLVNVLRAQGFEVELVTDPADLNVGKLSGAKVVMLNNVPAYRLPNDFLHALDFYVRNQGGGLLMAGGKFSFGAGGYFGSAIDDLLPVSMELREEHRKLAVAMVIVMDRSGSMACAAGNGVTKMDLADEGAARAVELLGAQDAVAVFAVDTEAHRIVPLTTVGGNQPAITHDIRRVVSSGGGIYCYTGLTAGMQELSKAAAGTRHIVLFADANDATQEGGDYKTLVDSLVKQGVTVSVIGLGGPHDSGADLLRLIAKEGQGRIFFNSNPNDLPNVFAQETVAIARSAFLDKPVQLTPTAGWMEIAARPLKWLDTVDGYNLSYLRKDATAALFSKDDYNAPLVAYWQRGIGRSVAISFPLGGDFSQHVRGWNSYGDFMQTLTRWLMGEEMPKGIGLRTHVDGTQLQLDLLHDDSWEEKFSQQGPKLVIEEGANGKAQEITWQRLEPGHYQCTIPLSAGKWIRGAVQVGKSAFNFGPIVAGTDPEWTFDRARVTELRDVSHLSGGQEVNDLANIWQSPRRMEFSDIRNPLLIVLLSLFVFETLATRLGWRLPDFVASAVPRLPKIRLPKKAPRPAPAVPSISPIQPVPTAAAKSPPATKSEQQRSRIFRAAKKRD